MQFSFFTLAAISLITMPVSAAEQSSRAVDLTPTRTTTIAELPPATIREGTHFINRTGRLNRGNAVHPSIFYFDPDGSSPAAPPMIVLQNLNLFSMESIQAGRSQPIRFQVSGTVAEFRGHDYVLFDQAQTISTPPGSRSTVVTRSTTHSVAVVQPVEKTSTHESQPTTDVLPSDTMARLLAQPPTLGEPLPPSGLNEFPALDRTTGTAAVAPAAPPLPVVREGTHLINRTARLSHSPDGKDSILTFDTDGKAMNDPPMLVLPNLKLQTMEDANKNQSKDAHYRVSGTITEYKGRNYIELDKAVMMADVEVQF